MTDFTKRKIDWQVYVERHNSICYVSIANEANGRLLREITGRGFTFQLYVFKNNTNTNYVSQQEYRELQSYFLDLIVNQPAAVRNLYKRCLAFLEIEDRLIKRFSKKIGTEEIKKTNQPVIQEITQIFAHLTTIPMMMLDAIDLASQKGDDNKKVNEALRLFQAFRKRSRNPLQEIVLKKLWRAAAESGGNSNVINYSYLTSEELNRFFESGKRPSPKEIAQRKRGCTLYVDINSGKMCFNYDSNFLERVGIQQRDVHTTRQLSGTTAYKGRVTGRVCVLNRTEEMKKFKVDDIIVSINTTPELMPALINCSGIVTDEGGLTCHASIISRELKKPCIVGTKIASKILKDGDIVTLDADNGEVLLIKTKDKHGES